jgi:hypothetical protein
LHALRQLAVRHRGRVVGAWYMQHADQSGTSDQPGRGGSRTAARFGLRFSGEIGRQVVEAGLPNQALRIAPLRGEDGLDVDGVEAFDMRRDERGALDGREPSQRVIHAFVDAKRGQRMTPRRFVRVCRAESSAAHGAEDMRAQPCGGTFGVSELVGVARPLSQRRASDVRRPMAIAERHEQREAVQSRAVHVTERGAQQFVVEVGSGRGGQGRRSIPSALTRSCAVR